MLLVLRDKAIIFMVEPLTHHFFHCPFYNNSWHDIVEHGSKAGEECQVPGIAIFRDTTQDPGTMSGADKHLVSKKECSSY